MADDFSPLRRRFAAGLGATAASSLIASPAWGANNDTYSEPEVVTAAENFFGAGAEGVAAVVRHVFEDNGRPVGYIQGEEGSGAIGVGLRYGDGRMHLKGRSAVTRVFWQGPSLGFDTGGNASKVFTLIYGMTNPDQIFLRYPGVDGSAYFVGGVGVNYARRNNITLAPMRAGVGLRLGANVGYLAYSRRRRINPF